MHTFTALYETRADAEAAQAQLEKLGIVDLNSGSVYGRDAPSFNADRYSTEDDRGIWSTTKGAFPPDEDRHLHEEHLRRGGFMLTVSVDDAEADQVHDVLENSNAIDVSERERQLKETGFAPPPASKAAAPTAAKPQSEERIALVEERLKVGKRQIERGGVRVRSYVVETPVREQVSLREEHVSIERRPSNQSVRNPDALLQNREIELTERAEEAVVAKDAIVREELVLRKDATQRVENIDETIRRTEVDIQDSRTTKPAGSVPTSKPSL